MLRRPALLKVAPRAPPLPNQKGESHKQSDRAHRCARALPWCSILEMDSMLPCGYEDGDHGVVGRHETSGLAVDGHGPTWLLHSVGDHEVSAAAGADVGGYLVA